MDQDRDPNARMVRVPCEKCGAILHGRVMRVHVEKRWTLKETHNRLDNGAPCDGTATFTVAAYEDSHGS
ncbi:MAG: hypothetical protein WAU32_11425 [Thermoanaerobaculia bacterium]